MGNLARRGLLGMVPTLPPRRLQKHDLIENKKGPQSVKRIQQ